MENNYSFSVFNQYCAGGVSRVLGEYNAANRSPIIVCVGSDLVLGDSLGPLVGTLLKKTEGGRYLYLRHAELPDHRKGDRICQNLSQAAASRILYHRD